ncbi:transposase, partial [Burkholderia vietnamiensis]|uniref:transposase n=5 Tax=Burkholderia cepacia complex TaxID=87882 RepID=UPI00264F208C
IGTACPPEVLPSAPCPGWSHHTLKPLGAGTRGTGYIMPVTNAIESLNMQLRKIIKTRGHFPNDEAAIKLLWLALRNVLAKTVRAAFDWKSAMNQFAILFGERFMQARG